MTFDIGINLAGTILGTGVLIIVLVLASARRTSRSEAIKASWEAWHRVAMEALSKGRDLPATPGDTPKR